MITKIKISGFQAHRNLTIELDPRVTTLTGPSDVGKSSVIRAIRWAMLNIPVSSLIHDGCKKAAVDVTIGEATVRRERGSGNAYYLDESEFRAFRSDVPEPISRVTNLHEVNFQGQHDPIYWFSASAGDVGRQLNSVVNLDVIDKTLAEANRIFNKAKTLAEGAADNLSEATKDCDDIAWVIKADKAYTIVEAQAKRCGQLRSTRDQAASAIQKVLVLQERAAASREIAEKAASLARKAGRAGKAAGLSRKLKSLLESISRADAARRQPVPDLGKLEASKAGVTEAAKQLQDLKDIIDACHERYRRKVAAWSIHLAAVAHFDEQADICPLCGQGITHE